MVFVGLLVGVFVGELVGVLVGVLVFVTAGVNVGVLVGEIIEIATELLVTGPPPFQVAIPLSVTICEKSVGKLGL